MVNGCKAGGKQHRGGNATEETEAENKLVELFIRDSGQLLFTDSRRGG